MDRRSALTPRSIALFLILYQCRLLAGELADTPIFVAMLLAGFTTAFLVRNTRTAPAILAALPWIARLLIAFPRLLLQADETNSAAVFVDSLLLHLDRNYFVALVPYYGASLTTFFAYRSRAFLRAEIIVSDLLLAALFSVSSPRSIPAYRLPIVMIATFALILFLQLLAFILSLPPALKTRASERVAAAGAMLALVISAGVLFLRPLQEQAIEEGGGLIQPSLFKFDFSQVIKLESEISMNDDLVFIVKKEAAPTEDGELDERVRRVADSHILLRRYVLSAYKKDTGFFREGTLDERSHRQTLPGGPAAFEVEPLEDGVLINQEYYMVNFDASAFMGMNEPVQVTPFESWDAASFNAAYAVQSLVSAASPRRLRSSSFPLPFDTGGMSAAEYAFYTDYGNDERLKAFAEMLTAGQTSYSGKINAVFETLKYGEYRYSLKPGIAPDGDQLNYFLFESKKGYCSYFAFSFALLLRSVGIPCRIAAGFFIDPSTNTFNYYPVRSDMAHAWVEVYFPRYGWLEFDPTSENLAAGEEFNFSSGVDPELFGRLMQEILENHSRLKAKSGGDEESDDKLLSALAEKTTQLVKRFGIVLIGGALAVYFLLMRTYWRLAAILSRNPRKKALLLWRHSVRRLAFAGYKVSGFESEWAAATDRHVSSTAALYQDSACARFAPVYGTGQYRAMESRYRLFSTAYRSAIPAARRLLAWLLPPIALLGKVKKPRITALLILCLFLAARPVQAQTQEIDDPDFFYRSAEKSEQAENWERAIEYYREGERKFPEDSRFPRALGDLYYSNSFYALAFEEYRVLNALLPADTDALYKLSQVTGRLNKDSASASYLEQLLVFKPHDQNVLIDLGWMYFKLHRLEEGAALLEAALKKDPRNNDFEMTLATIYSDMFRYEDSKKQYRAAIADAEAKGESYFMAIAYYNLSILESRFYYYELAFKATEDSLAAYDRASGHLARGEAFLRRLDIAQTIADYETAYETDTSPLAKLNLAEVYQIAGRLTEAKVYAEDCLAAGDNSWMLYFGIDPVQYKRDIHEILAKTYRGLAETERFMQYASPCDAIKSVFQSAFSWFKGEVHRHLFKKYALLSANAYQGEEPHLEALNLYYKAFESYPRRAASYIRQGRKLETPLIPQSGSSYQYKEAALFKNRRLLNETVSTFDPVWERDMITEAYTSLARLKGADAPEAAEKLFALNRGALRQQGIRLPVRLFINAYRENRSIEKAIQRAVEKAGFSVDKTSRFSLTITIDGATALCRIDDKGAAVFTHTFPLPDRSNGTISAFSRALGNALFHE